MSSNTPISVFWFRRDLRLNDNHALHHALKANRPLLLVFIFDEDIIDELPPDDHRITFIYDTLHQINEVLLSYSSSLLCLRSNVVKAWQHITSNYNVSDVYLNEDYEPYGIKRDLEVQYFLNQHQIALHSYKDQVIFAKNEILKKDGKPYTVFSPYKKLWLAQYSARTCDSYPIDLKHNLLQETVPFPNMQQLGIERSSRCIMPYDLDHLHNYAEARDIPSITGTSFLGPHLRFGTVGTRSLMLQVAHHEVFLSELIWREFFMQILFHFPKSITHNFKSKYDNIRWLNNTQDFNLWKNGQTGYPLVDAGMHQLRETGYMHNRVRMITASFLCKHLLVDWRWGEAYFAMHLADYELSSNVGNWQWAASTGCDAVPYFRIFNPIIQLKKFDPDFEYVKRWIPNFNAQSYLTPMVEHTFARSRALNAYKRGLNPD